MIKPGDYVVLTGKKWDFSYGRYSIQGIKNISGELVIFLDGDGRYIVPGWEVQRIQDYFQPGDRVEVMFDDKRGMVSDVISWSLYENDTLLCVGDHELKITKFDTYKSIRNLTKEKQEKEVNMQDHRESKAHFTTQGCKPYPMKLTDKDLVALGGKACKEGKDAFYKEFGSEVELTDHRLKTFLEKHNLKDYVKDNLPDHYAVIFPEPTFGVNDYAFIDDTPNDICRIYDIIDERIMVIFHDGKVVGYDKHSVKPISERPFQVGDMVWDKSMRDYKRIGDTADLERANNNKTRFDLIISPAIPEVK